MTSLILYHVARAYLYLRTSTQEKVVILLLSHSLGVVTGQNKTTADVAEWLDRRLK